MSSVPVTARLMEMGFEPMAGPPAFHHGDGCGHHSRDPFGLGAQPMRVLIDRHHHGLLEAYMLTLGDRLGYEVWCPYGMDWFDSETWNFERQFHGDAVARQYLLGIWGDTSDPDIVTVKDTRHPNRTLRGISYEAARDTQWDLVISSLPHNDEGYHRFAQEAGARFGVQVGNNVQQSRWDLADFILSSSTLDGFGPEWVGKRFEYQGVPAVMYHQEFSLDIFRHEWPPANRREVASWVNCFPETPPYAQFRDLARQYGDEFDWKCYGAYGSAAMDELSAGDVSWVPDIADRMREARIGWHAKHWSDGFGHTIHNWFAIGRPVVGWRRYYEDKIAGALWVEGETAFDVEDFDIATLRRLRDDDDYHRRISENAAARFREIVDFDAEATTIRSLLESVA